MENEKKITKIVINKEDELTDVVSAILESYNERIVLTFAEETDLLISPINLKVLLETADESEKLIIAQIIKNPTGLRNAHLAGITTIDTPTFPLEDMWEKEGTNRANRLNPPKEKPISTQEETVSTEELESEGPSDFQKRVAMAIEKGSARRKDMNEEKDVLISLDEDLPSKNDEIPIVVDPDLSKVDFSEKTVDPQKVSPNKIIKERRSNGPNITTLGGKFKSFFSNIPIPTKLKKLGPIIGISVVVLTLLIGFIYINTAMLVRVRIYVEAKEVSVERIFQGDENIKEIDFEELKIPVKSESVEKSRSTNVRATGKAFKGEKAKGKVNVFYKKEGSCVDVAPIALSAGQTIATDDKTFTLDSNVSVACNSTAEVPISAIEVGEEYNLASGQFFTVQGFSKNEIWASNSSSAITGGSKQEYTVLSKADVDTAVEDLRKIAVEEGENELRDKGGNWAIIEDSIKSEVIADSIKTDVAVGAEATEVNVSMKTTSIASYYLKEGFDDGVAELLTKEAQDNNLFESDRDLELELDSDIEKDVSVAENNAQGIKIKLVAKSSVKPKVDKEEILNELKTKNWEEGQKYLKDLEFSDKETNVEFLPENFPEYLRRFPKRQGGVLISVVNVN
jgi:hypothetical protein